MSIIFIFIFIITILPLRKTIFSFFFLFQLDCQPVFVKMLTIQFHGFFNKRQSIMQ